MQYAPRNYSRGDVAVAEMTVSLLAAFAKTGDPTPRADERHHDGVTSWPRYEMNTQQYLSIGKNMEYNNGYHIYSTVSILALFEKRDNKVFIQTS